VADAGANQGRCQRSSLRTCYTRCCCCSCCHLHDVTKLRNARADFAQFLSFRMAFCVFNKFVEINRITMTHNSHPVYYRRVLDTESTNQPLWRQEAAQDNQKQKSNKITNCFFSFLYVLFCVAILLMKKVCIKHGIKSETTHTVQNWSLRHTIGIYGQNSRLDYYIAIIVSSNIRIYHHTRFVVGTWSVLASYSFSTVRSREVMKPSGEKAS